MRLRVALGVAIVWIAGMVLAIGLGQGAAHAQSRPTKAPVAKIAVTNSGITYDGVAVTLDELKVKITDLKKRNGKVLYYRQPSNGHGDPPANALEVIQLLLDNKLPVSMAGTPDFSDGDDEDGAGSDKE